MTTEYESNTALAPELEQQTPWNEARAQQLALDSGLGELTDDHWKVIHTLREHFVQYGALPPMRLACGINHLDPRCGEILFDDKCEPWRVAGLPEPGSEENGYL